MRAQTHRHFAPAALAPCVVAAALAVAAPASASAHRVAGYRTDTATAARSHTPSARRAMHARARISPRAMRAMRV
jgi:hypothetical protein